MVTHELAFARSNPSTIMGWLPIPDPESGRTRQALWSVALHGSTTRERLTAFRVLIERDAIFAPTVLDDALSRETDPIMKAWELRLIGFHRGTKQSEQIGKFLDDPNPSVRAAAADALGMMYGGTGNGQLLQDPYMGSYPTTISDPPMALIETRPYTHFVRDVGALVATMPDVLRSRLQRMMIEGRTIEERQSAARAIVGYAPPDYRLRLAEWGVWLAGADDGRLQSVLSDIPPFVHTTGDSAQSVQALAQAAAAKRRGLPIPIVTTKPVIHLTASVPISLDLKVSIRSGRPWYVYPRPDEFMFDHAVQSNTPLDPAGLKELAPEFHSGYDWLVPSFPTDGTSSPARSPTGLRWQNLIVTPTRQPWMQPASVNDDAKYAWWTRLRNVDCSWISNREESERFLYYDGPTMLRCPVQFAWENDGLVVRQVERNAATQFFGAGAPQTRVALLLHVENGKVEAEQLQIPITNGPFNYKWPVTPEGQKVDGPPDAAFFKLVTRGGLTTSEATGMLECWRKPFFQNDGVRLLMFLSAKDYETVCSVTVKPAPTESARVGIIWAELK
jgi:hypothetical protein